MFLKVEVLNSMMAAMVFLRALGNLRKIRLKILDGNDLDLGMTLIFFQGQYGIFFV